MPLRQHRFQRRTAPRLRIFLVAIASLFFLSTIALPAALAPAFPQQASHLVHGLWVWKGPSILATDSDDDRLRDFCRSQGINEVYLSISSHGQTMPDNRIAHLIHLLHASQIHVEALLSSEDADEPGKHRGKLLDHVREILQFNRGHDNARFDGVHLDIEPQQRPENKGPGNLRFLPNLVDAYRAVRQLADPAGLTVNADIQNKLLKASASDRKLLLTSLPRLTLMLYELSSPTDKSTPDQKAAKLRAESQKFLDMAYDGLTDLPIEDDPQVGDTRTRNPHLAKLIIGLRTPDYGTLLPEMFETLDESNRSNPHYAGWSRHSYNDTLNDKSTTQ